MDSLLYERSCNVGKYRRMKHLFSDSGKCLIVPLDDSLITGPKKGLVHIEKKIEQIASAKPSALITYLGAASIAKQYDVPIILNISASTVLSNHTNKVIISSVEQALAIDADAVAVHINFSSKYESDMLQNMIDIKRSCDIYGMPLMILAYPRKEIYESGRNIDDNYDELKTKEPEKYTELVCHAVRIAFELGADIIKTQYTGSVESFRKVIDSAQGVPVVIAGGIERETEDVIDMVRGATDAGASGVSIGRNVFDKVDSDKIILSIKDILFS